MKVLTIVSAAIFVLLCPIIRLAVCRGQPMGEPKIANWQNANSRLAHEWLVGCFTGTVIETSFILFSYRHPAKYSSLFTKSPESPVFIGIPRGEEYSGTLHLLFTTLHPSVLADLQSTYQSFASVSVSEGKRLRVYTLHNSKKAVTAD